MGAVELQLMPSLRLLRVEELPYLAPKPPHLSRTPQIQTFIAQRTITMLLWLTMVVLLGVKLRDRVTVSFQALAKRATEIKKTRIQVLQIQITL